VVNHIFKMCINIYIQNPQNNVEELFSNNIWVTLYKKKKYTL